MNRIKNFITLFLEIGYLVMNRPQELALFIPNVPSLRPHAILSATLASLALSVSLYSLRPFYGTAYLMQILIMFISFLFMLMIFALIFGSLTDMLVFIQLEKRSGRTLEMILITLFSFLPYLFFFPSVTIAKITPYTGTLSFLFFALTVLWSLSILFSAMQFLYELEFRTAFRVFIQASAICILFPCVIFFTITSGLVGIFF